MRADAKDLLKDLQSWLETLGYRPGEVIEEESKHFIRRIDTVPLDDEYVEFAPANDDARRLAEALTNNERNEA